MKKGQMIQFLAVAITAIFTIIFTMSSEAATGSFTCKYQSGDIGMVIGQGSTQAQAFEDAAEQCFDRHQALVKKFRGDEEAKKRGLLHIDLCANITCS